MEFDFIQIPKTGNFPPQVRLRHVVAHPLKTTSNLMTKSIQKIAAASRAEEDLHFVDPRHALGLPNRKYYKMSLQKMS